MKKIIQFLLFSCAISTSLFAVKREGLAEANDWTPPRGAQSAAQIKHLSLKWYMDDNDGTGTPVKSASIQWQLGESYILKSEKHAIETLLDAANQLTFKHLELRAEVCGGRDGKVPLGFTTFMELNNVQIKPGVSFSAEARTFIDWNTVFEGIAADSAKKIFANGFSLCNLQITAVEFAGTEKVEAAIANSAKNEAFNQKITEGDKAMASKDYPTAEDLYDAALQIIPNQPQGVEKLKLSRAYLNMIEGDRLFQEKKYEDAKKLYEEAEKMAGKNAEAINLAKQKLAAVEVEMAKSYYEKYVKEGDEAVARKDYSTARSKYEYARKLFPNDSNIQETIKDKLNIIQFELAKIDYDRLIKEATDATARKEFNTAKSKYEQAGKIFPTDNNVQQYVQQQLSAVSVAMVQDSYASMMRQGDLALTNKQFQQAIGFYQQALGFMPNDAAATAAITESNRQIQLVGAYNQLVKDLKAKYEKQIKAAASEQKEAFAQAAKAYETNCESCNMEYVKYYACMEDFLQEKWENVQAEAAYEVYKDPAAKAKAEISNMCVKPNCNQFDANGVLDKANSNDALATARRKYQLYQKDNKKYATFKDAAKEFTDLAVSKDSKNYAAMAFGANFAEDLIEGMAIAKQVLALSPSNTEALGMKKTLEYEFFKKATEAIQQGNLKFVQKLVDRKLIADVVANGTNVWEQAIDNNQGEVLNVLLKEADAQNLQNYLFRAVEKASKNCVMVLLQAGAKADTKNASGESAMTLASRKGNQGIVDVLSQKSSDKSAALLVAVNENQLETAKTLLKNGANTEAKDGKGDNLLMIAMSKKSEAMMNLLLDNGANVNHENYKGETPLDYAAFAENSKLITKLLEKGAKPEEALKAINPENVKTLQLLVTEIVDVAINKGNVAWVQTADKYFSNIAELLNDKNQPFILAALEKNNLMIGKILLASGTDFNKLVGGKYLLLEVAEKGKKDWMQELLNIPSLNMNVRTAAKENVLHLAAKNDDDELINMLLPFNVEKDAQDEKGNTPLLTALTLNKKLAAQAIFKSGVNIGTFNYRSLQAIHLAVANKDINMVAALIKAGASVNSVGENGLTPLHYAAQNGDTNICKLLINSGADKTLKDNYKRTAAAVAKKYKYKEIAKLLK